MLLKRNNLWSNDIARYLIEKVASCIPCHYTDKPQAIRKVSISKLDRPFNTVSCISHFYLEQQPIFHAMEDTARYSVGQEVRSSAVCHGIDVLEQICISEFWVPGAIRYDVSFESK